MICPNCNTNTPGIKLNGKLYCPQCGSILPKQPTAPVPESISSTPEPKIITPEESQKENIEKEIDELGVELKALDEIEHTAKFEEKEQEQTTELASLEAAEKLVDSLQVTPKEEAPEEQPASVIVKANRERTSHPKATEPKEVAVAKEQEPESVEERAEETAPIAPEISETPIETQDLPNPVEETETIPEPEIKEPESEPEPEPKAEQTPESEIITEPEPETEQVPKTDSENEEPAVTEVPEVPNEEEQIPQNDKLSINLVQAEKGYCVKCKFLRDIDNPENVTMKNGHPAVKGKCSVCSTTIFKIIKGPVKAGYHREKNKADATVQHIQTPAVQNQLTSFFKSKVESINQPIKKEKKPIKFSWKIFLSILIPFVLISAFVGLVLYVNIFAINAERAKTKAESTVTFNYEKPGYIPPGYVLTADTNAAAEQIVYVYNFVTIDGKGKESVTDTFEITISKYKKDKEQAYEDNVRSTGRTYSQVSIADTEIYILDNKDVVFYKNGVLYEISSSGKISRGELIKIASSFVE